MPLKSGVDTKTPVPKQILDMSPETFFNRLNRLLAGDPPEPDDPKTMARLATLGIAPGATFSMSAFAPDVRKAIKDGVPGAIKTMRETVRGEVVNGWQIARHGALRHELRVPRRLDVLRRRRKPGRGRGLSVRHHGRGWQAVQRREQLHAAVQEVGDPACRCVLVVDAVDEDSYFVDNPLNRYALGDRSHLTPDADGGLTLYIQHDSPGKDKESNWLPAPKDAGFKLALRLYSPKKEVANGTWKPPAVKRVG